MLSCKTAFAGDSNIWLDKLDKSLDRRDYFDRQRTDRIEQLRQGLAKARENGREYEQLYALFDEYRAYCYDSARFYASACLESAQASGNQDKVVKAKNAIAFSLISAGILSEAHALLQTIDRSLLSAELQLVALHGRLCQRRAILYQIHHAEQCLPRLAETALPRKQHGVVVLYGVAPDAQSSVP